MKHNSAPVLIIESNSDLRDLYQMGLLVNGITALTAKNQEDAFAIIASNHPKLVLVDEKYLEVKLEDFCHQLKTIFTPTDLPSCIMTFSESTEIPKLVQQVEQMQLAS